MCVFFNDTATTEIYTYGHTLSLHDALPICRIPIDARQQAGGAARCLNDVVIGLKVRIRTVPSEAGAMDIDDAGFDRAASVIIEAEPRDRLAADVVEKDVGGGDQADRKSTRLNSSH